MAFTPGSVPYAVRPSQAELSGPHLGGEPERVDRGGDDHAGRWLGGARCSFINAARVDPEPKRSDYNGSDKAYDRRDFVDTLRELASRRTWPAGSTARSTSEPAGVRDTRSLSKRWLVEKLFATDLTFGFQAGIGDRSEA